MFPKLRRVTLTSGESIEISNGVTAIVGPNNAGKSLLLAEVNRWFSLPQGFQLSPPNRVLRELSVSESAPMTELLEWLGTRYPHRGPGTYPQGEILQPHLVLPNNNYIPDMQVHQHINTSGRFGPLGSIYALHVVPGGARDIASASGTFNTLTEQPQTPVQRLWASRDQEERISALVKRAFNVRLTVNRHGGNQITVHLGAVSTPAPPMPPTQEYLEEIRSLPQVQDQGDGVKAFVGMLLSIMTADYPLLLIDEPETFLHPPQAYLLGQILAEQHDRDGQVVLATHSADVIRGLTSTKASSGAVSIVRLTRNDSINHAAQLSTATMRGLYDDPLIRYYNILDGLFFHGTVLCEADSDCTYYRAVLDSNESLDDGTPIASISLHFTHCAGKARLAKAIMALRAAKVPVACVVDIDVLHNDWEFKDIVEACGGNPEDYMALRNNVVSEISSRDAKLDRTKTEHELTQLLNSKKSGDLSSAEVNKLTAVLKPKSGWKEFKRAGHHLLSGDVRASFDDLNAKLRQLGIFIVEIGELERFHPNVSGGDNKADWLRIVLEQRLYEKSDEASKFVTAIASNILGRQ